MTFVDFGTAAPCNFAGFYHHVIERSTINILAFLHIACNGLQGALCYPYSRHVVGELEDIRYALPELVARTAQKYPDVIRGIKARCSIDATGNNGLAAMRLAQQVSTDLELPLAVHIGAPPLAVCGILPLMGTGDILTHSFRGPNSGLVNSKAGILAEAREARERGVLFDIGHGRGSFCSVTARKLIERGFLSDTVSSDIHAFSRHSVGNLAQTIQKLIALGMPLERVIAAATCAPARTLGMERSLGKLSEGCPANVNVLSENTQSRVYRDTNGVAFEGQQGFEIHMTLKEGKVLFGKDSRKGSV